MSAHFTKTTQYSQVLQTLFEKSHKEEYKDVILLLGKNIFDIRSKDIENKIGINDLGDKNQIDEKLTQLPNDEFESLKYFVKTFENFQIIKDDTKEYGEVDLDLLEKGFSVLGLISSMVDEMGEY